MTVLPPRHRIPRRTFVTAFLLITLALLGVGYWYYRAQADSICRNKYENLAAIAKLKVGQIVQWRKERLLDVAREAASPGYSNPLGKIVLHEETPGMMDRMLQALIMARNGTMYSHAFILSLSSQVLLSSGDGPVVIGSSTQKATVAALNSPGGVVSDFFRDPNGEVYIDAVEAVRDTEKKPLGFVVLRTRAKDYLYPLIQTWPTVSRSAETLLVQREGDHLVFLNELRHQKDSALSLRHPLTQTDIPGVQAVLGKTGKFEGKDYRGVPVLADLCAIPESPWFMVAKVDFDEVMSEARYRAASTGVIVGSLILLAGSLTAFAYGRRQTGLLKRVLESEAAEKKSHEMFRTTLYSIGDGVLTADTEGRVREMNPVAEWLTGWTEAEARGKLLEEVFVIVNQETRAIVTNPVATVLRDGVVVGLANHTVLIARDGTEHAIADSAAPIRDESGDVNGVVLVFSDVTEEYKMQETLRRREQEYRMLFEGMVEGFASHEILCDENGKPVDYRFLSMNPAFERLTGLSAVDAVGRTVREVFPNIEPVWIERYGRVALTGEPIHFEDYTEALGRHYAISAFCPQPKQFAVMVEDITARKAAEVRIERLSHLYAALSQCNQAIVHSASVEELLPKICREVVNLGGMTMVWIGFLDEATGMVRPVAAHGSGTDYLEKSVQITVNANDPSGRGPTGTAIREGRPVWVQDYANDPTTLPWRERAAHYGWQSAAAIPLRQGGRPVGSLTIYSDKTDAFDAEVRKLLEEMADDISFALKSFAHEAERQQVQARLRESEILYRSLFENLLNGFAYCQMLFEDEKPSDFIYLAVNAAFTSQTGLKDVVGKKVSEVIPGIQKSDPELIATYGRVAVSGQPERFELFVEALKMWFAISVYSPQRGYFVAVFDVITERKQAEAALQESEERLSFALKTNQMGSWEINLLDQTTQRDPIHDRIFGYETLLPRWTYEMFLEHVLPEDRPDVDRKFREAIAAQSDWNFECRILRADGEVRWISAAGGHQQSAEGRPVRIAGIVQDITKRKQLEEMLMQTERMESIGRLASGVAHDLNNILTPIILSAEMLHATDDAETRKCLIASIEECAQRGASVVNQVLTFARGARGEHTALQLDSLVAAMEKMIKETFPKNITIATEIPAGLWPIVGDSTQLHQVLLNLSINARDAMPEGGAILITAENAEIDENFAAMVPDAVAGDYVMLAVSDTGTGIPQEILGKIFDPFFTTKEVGKGTGLGLSTVMGIVRSHGGFIAVESKEGCGSTFKLFLPVAEEESRDKKKARNKHLPQGKGAIVLVVDDEEPIARATEFVLEKNGYKVLVAADGASALALFKEHAKKIKIVLTDIMMPGMDGVALTRALREINPHTTIIASTGQATETRQAELLSLGVKQILRKPYDAKKLLVALHEATQEV